MLTTVFTVQISGALMLKIRCKLGGKGRFPAWTLDLKCQLYNLLPRNVKIATQFLCELI